MSIRPCMGGFCQRRSNCPHHESPANYANPAERICDPGNDGVVDGRLLRFLRESSSTDQVFPSQMLLER